MNLPQLARSAAYGAIDRVTARRGIRHRINNESMRFPPQWARYYPPVYQPDTYRFLQTHCRAGTTAVDAGAHLGVFSITMARLVGPHGRVLAFEPTPETRDVLTQVLALNRVDSIVDVRAAALAEADGSADLHTSGAAVGVANSLVTLPSTSSSLTVTTHSLDSVLEAGSAVSCLKIDVEGAETAVLKGAKRTIENNRPAIALDVHPDAISRGNGSLPELWNTIRDLGYEVRNSSSLIRKAEFVEWSDPTDVQLTHRAGSH